MVVKDLPRMIRYLKDRGTYVLFNTNGTLSLMLPKATCLLVRAGVNLGMGGCGVGPPVGSTERDRQGGGRHRGRTADETSPRRDMA